MKQKLLNFLLILVMLTPLNLSLAHEGHNEAFGGEETAATASEAITVDPEGQRAIGLRVQTVAVGTVDRTFNTTGQVQPSENQANDINPPVNGVVRQVYVKQGDWIRSGQTLATIHSPDVAEALSTHLQERARLQAEIATNRTQAQRDIAVQQNQVELTRANYLREQTLLSEGITARKDYIEAKNAYETAQVELAATKRQSAQQIALLQRQLALTAAAVKSQLRAMGLPAASVDKAIANFRVTSQIPIVSPVSGYLTFRDITPGETVDTTKRIFSIVNLSQVWVILNVFQEQIPQIRLGQTVRMTTPANQAVSGEISSIGAVVDPNQRTLPVRVVSSNPGGLLKPGMFVKADIITGQSGGSRIVVPIAALIEEGGRTLVYVKQGNRFLPTSVQVGQRTSEEAEILDGLYAGDQVVIQGARQLQAQARIAGNAAGAAETETQQTPTESQGNNWLSMVMGIGIGLGLAALSILLWQVFSRRRIRSRRG